MEIQVLPEPNYPVSPEQFIGRKTPSEAFTLALQQGLAAGRISSFAVLGDWGIGKSSLLLKFAAICSDPKYGILPVLVPVSTDYGDYRRFAESLLDGLAEALAATSSLTTRLRTEVRNWKLKRVSMGGFTLDREAQRFFLSSGSTLLRHALGEAWKRFFLPAQISGAMFFLDDLDNFATSVAQDVARTLRDQFQWLGINRMNYSVCFSARSDYFSAIRSFAEPAVRFYTKFYLEPFLEEETTEYAEAAFRTHEKLHGLLRWLYEKTLGHPYFLAFICRELLACTQGSVPESPEHLWPHVFQQLERNKFRLDLAQVPERELELLRTLAGAQRDEINPRHFIPAFQYAHFGRLTEKGLLIRTGRGRYKLYHPLFSEFLRQTK